MANVIADHSDGISTLVDRDGNLLTKINVSLTTEEHKLLRMYRKFLAHRGLREALYCTACWNGSREDGTRASVTDHSALIECRCKTRSYYGMSV